MTLNSISKNLAPITRKQNDPTPPKCDSPQEVAESVKLTGQAELDRGTELKNQAAAAKAAAQEKEAAANQQIADGAGKVFEGSAKMAQGFANEASNTMQIQDGINNEQAATEKADAAASTYSDNLATAKTAHEAITGTLVDAGQGIIAERLGSRQLSGNLNTLNGQLAEAQGPRGTIEGGIGSLQAGIASEKAGSAQVHEGISDHANASVLFDDGTNQLRTGRDEVASAGVHEHAAKDKDSRAAGQREKSTELSGISDAKAAEAQDAKGRADQHYTDADAYFAAGTQHSQEADNAAQVADLLAQLAAVDSAASQSLIAIPSFEAEGQKTGVDSQIKDAESANRQAEAGVHADLADALNNEGNISSSHGDEETKTGLFLDASSIAFAAKAAGLGILAANNEAAAAELHDAAATLQAQGEADQTEGAAKRDEGQAGIDAAEAKISGGFQAEKDGADAQAAAIPTIEAGQAELEPNTAARENTINLSSQNANLIGAALDSQSQSVASAQGSLNDIKATVAPRLEALANLTIAQKERHDAIDAQTTGLEGLQDADALRSEGLAEIKDGQHDVRKGKIDKNDAQVAGKKADEQDAAGTVIADKGQKYVDLANQTLDPSKKK